MLWVDYETNPLFLGLKMYPLLQFFFNFQPYFIVHLHEIVL